MVTQTIEHLDLVLLRHSSPEPQALSACTLAFSVPTLATNATPPEAPPTPDAAAPAAAATAPARLRLQVTCAQLPEPMELLVATDCGASFPPDGSVVLPLGSTAQDAQTLLIRSSDSATEARLQGEFKRILGQFKNIFDAKTEEASSHMYFHYYGMLQHQQNMLQDATRTGTYYWAIMNNRQDFEGKVVVDVGAGTGILSLFAAQAGARKVYAIEASKMANFAQKLFESNGEVGSRVQVMHGKVEALLDALPEKADILISEPMGTLLVNERMLETYILARKHFLKPGGLMFPGTGRVFVAAFADSVLHAELQSMASFWLNSSFYGVNLTSLHGDALEGYCGKVVIDAFDPGLLKSPYTCLPIDFSTADEQDLQDITIPLYFTCQGPGVIHGVACWFDVNFPGTQHPMWLSTAPGMAATHWFQLRCVLQTPITIQEDGQLISGELRLKAHAAQSYDLHLSLQTQSPPHAAMAAAAASDTAAADTPSPMDAVQSSSGVFDLKDPYYRQLRTPYVAAE